MHSSSPSPTRIFLAKKCNRTGATQNVEAGHVILEGLKIDSPSHHSRPTNGISCDASHSQDIGTLPREFNNVAIGDLLSLISNGLVADVDGKPAGDNTSRLDTSRPASPVSGDFVGDIRSATSAKDTTSLLHFCGDEVARDLDTSLRTCPISRFHSQSVPEISFRDYLMRIAKYTNAEPSLLLSAVVLCNRISRRHPLTAILSPFAVHRTFITAFLLASKVFSDSFFFNDFYAKVGGINTAEMNVLEVDFLLLIQWDLVITRKELQTSYRALAIKHPHYVLERV